MAYCRHGDLNLRPGKRALRRYGSVLCAPASADSGEGTERRLTPISDVLWRRSWDGACHSPRAALGLTLKEIKAFVGEIAPDERVTPKILTFLTEQRDRLTCKVDELQRLIAFLDAKIAWIKNPEEHMPPVLPGWLPAR
jgi:hypothetical protein